MDIKYGYIILPKGWEYDDQYYSESGFSKPSIIFSNEKDALVELEKKEINDFKTKRIELYFGEDGIDEYLIKNTTIQTVINLLNHILLKNYDEDNLWDIDLLTNATDKQIKELMGLINLRFNTMIKIEIK